MAKQSRRTARGFQRRVADIRPRVPNILIVCEGACTEPNYFRAFRVARDVAEVRVEGVGDNTYRVVEQAIELRADGDYDQVWCVFDRDSFPPEHFNRALQVAQAKGIKVAYSNEAFELWYVLHFDYLNTGISRKDYITRLNQLLGRDYHKGSTDMFDALKDRQETALRNAAKLLAEYGDDHRPERDNPSTTVHLLVAELNTYRR
jgi:hypothetical protein